jgi:hypothetical protein
MIFIANVSYTYHPYMDDEVKEKTANHTVEAASKDDAERKIETHYNRKSSDHGDGYSVTGIEFFEHIP